MTVTKQEIEATLSLLLDHCKASDWAGYEPYDALSSKLFDYFPFLNSRIPRLALTQTLKRSPIDLRRVLGIEKAQNPKAMAVFLTAFVRLAGSRRTAFEPEIDRMIERLVSLRSPGVPYWCWGYSFAWQTRTDLVPKWAPNLVCTCFVADALLDVYEARGDARCLEMAANAADYILKELYWTDGPAAGFSYPMPGLRGQVHNANFLAAAVLCRVHRHTGEKSLLSPALRMARYSASRQRPDGSWHYGEAPKQRWIDNFHTGYNLLALRQIDRSLGSGEFAEAVKRGFDFYRQAFYLKNGAVRYYHDRTYPIDAHCIAQSIITPLELHGLNPNALSVAESVFRWAMDHLWDERGFFYYRVLRACTIRTSYLRWTQAWMFLALATLLCAPEASGGEPDRAPAAAGLGARS